MNFAGRLVLSLLLGAPLPATLHAQGTLADYQRAHDLQEKARDLVVNVPGPAHWIGDTHRFWYAHTVKSGTEYLLVDADAANKKPAFDQEKLAEAVNKAAGTHYTALKLPFEPTLAQRGGGRQGDHLWRGRLDVSLRSRGLHLHEDRADSCGWSWTRGGE
jgi:hypothetical protein